MAKQKACTICKHYGIETPPDKQGELEKTNVFDESGTPVPILLCKKHSVELFKMGQKKFLLSHYKILIDLVGSDEMKFLEVLEKTIKKNTDQIF
jgi:hypothetical protein